MSILYICYKNSCFWKFKRTTSKSFPLSPGRGQERGEDEDEEEILDETDRYHWTIVASNKQINKQNKRMSNDNTNSEIFIVMMEIQKKWINFS